MAAFDELSAGRAVLGIGAGIGTKVRKMQLATDRPIAAVRDAMTIARRLLRGEDVSYTGKVFSVDGVRLEFPLRRTDMPILMAAMGEQALRLCAEVADGLMISNMCPPAYTRRAVEIMREAAARAGRPAPREVVQYVPCAVRDDGDEARRLAKDTVAAARAIIANKEKLDQIEVPLTDKLRHLRDQLTEFSDEVAGGGEDLVPEWPGVQADRLGRGQLAM